MSLLQKKWKTTVKNV